MCLPTQALSTCLGMQNHRSRQSWGTAENWGKEHFRGHIFGFSFPSGGGWGSPRSYFCCTGFLCSNGPCGGAKSRAGVEGREAKRRLFRKRLLTLVAFSSWILQQCWMCLQRRMPYKGLGIWDTVCDISMPPTLKPGSFCYIEKATSGQPYSNKRHWEGERWRGIPNWNWEATERLGWDNRHLFIFTFSYVCDCFLPHYKNEAMGIAQQCVTFEFS